MGFGLGLTCARFRFSHSMKVCAPRVGGESDAQYEQTWVELGVELGVGVRIGLGLVVGVGVGVGLGFRVRV